MINKIRGPVSLKPASTSTQSNQYDGPQDISCINSKLTQQNSLKFKLLPIIKVRVRASIKTPSSTTIRPRRLSIWSEMLYLLQNLSFMGPKCTGSCVASGSACSASLIGPQTSLRYRTFVCGWFVPNSMNTKDGNKWVEITVITKILIKENGLCSERTYVRLLALRFGWSGQKMGLSFCVVSSKHPAWS